MKRVKAKRAAWRWRGGFGGRVGGPYDARASGAERARSAGGWGWVGLGWAGGLGEGRLECYWHVLVCRCARARVCV